jgi:MEMO1 family protein
LSQTLPQLRFELNFFPSPSQEHPGWLVSDPFRYTQAVLLIPPLLAQCLPLFNGRSTEGDLREALVKLTRDLDVSEIIETLVETLSAAGFLEDESFARIEATRRAEFTALAVREPAHAGAAYPAEPDALRETMVRYLDGAAAAPHAAAADGLFAIAAPHVSPEGGWQSYRAAYATLRPEHRDRTFVILATSHYGRPERFGLTRKNFRTPVGDAITDQRLVDWLATQGGGAVEMEDFCHSFEHTVELQVIFLQHMLGPGVRILPILVGSFAHSLLEGGVPEKDDDVQRFFDALGELDAREGGKLFWVLGVDMAHMGARYQDPFTATAGEGTMLDVDARDRRRIDAINASDAGAFWEQVREGRDDLKWCGSAPFYTFLKALPKSRGELLRYEQWNIDERSVVSFAGMAFRR